ncbi:uncharacterized protein BcabD6B2_24760 [Babesia caballi]|uniref:Uncharacterized protein n=1 Tax=Babesia caballi TaxID=5871 RepID=A0AAV4LVB0_BABCB|nr:hypothetical protein, conserved [Babesia caballi]
MHNVGILVAAFLSLLYVAELTAAVVLDLRGNGGASRMLGGSVWHTGCVSPYTSRYAVPAEGVHANGVRSFRDAGLRPRSWVGCAWIVSGMQCHRGHRSLAANKSHAPSGKLKAGKVNSSSVKAPKKHRPAADNKSGALPHDAVTSAVPGNVQRIGTTVGELGFKAPTINYGKSVVAITKKGGGKRVKNGEGAPSKRATGKKRTASSGETESSVGHRKLRLRVSTRNSKNVTVTKDSFPPKKKPKSSPEAAHDARGNLAAETDPGVTISKRRLHALETLFSTLKTLNTREIVSILYHLIGYVNTELTSLYDNLREVTEKDKEFKHANIVVTSTEVSESAAEQSGDTNHVSDDAASPLVSDDHSAFDGVNLPFDADSSYLEDTSQNDDVSAFGNTEVKGHWDDLENSGTSLSRREVRRLRHMQMLAKHERLKLLRDMDRRKCISAVFFPANDFSMDQPEAFVEHNAGEYQVPPSSNAGADSFLKSGLEKATYDKIFVWKTSNDASGGSDGSGGECLSGLEAQPSGVLLHGTKVSNMPDDCKTKLDGGPDYALRPDSGVVPAAPAVDDNRRFESLVVAIPKPPLKMQENGATKAVPVTKTGGGCDLNTTEERDTPPGMYSENVARSDGSEERVEKPPASQDPSTAFDIPVTIFSLRRGFFSTLYDKFLRQSLVSTLERAFDTKLENPCGVMDLKRLNLDSLAQTSSFEMRLDRDVLRQHVRNVVVRSRVEDGEKDAIEYTGTLYALPEEFRRKVAEIFKWVKDEVFLRSCVDVLTTLLGRAPTVSELAFSLGHDDPAKLELALGVCGSYTQRCFEGLANPMADVILLKLEAECGVERKRASGALELIDPYMYNTEAASVDALWQRMCSIHLNTISTQGDKALSQLYGVACSAARHDLLRAKLPEHLPIGKYQLARRATAVYKKLLGLQGRVASEVRKSLERGVPLPEDLYKTRPFAQRVMEVEQAYLRAAPDSAEATSRAQKLRCLIQEEMAAVLQVSWDAVQEALDAARVREISGPRIEGLPDRPSRFKRRRGPVGGHILDYDDLGEPEDPECLPLKPWTVEHQSESMRRKSLRMVAVEALDERVARFVFMAYLDLFTRGMGDSEELATALGLSGPDVTDFIFYAARAHCQWYEFWRIKLKLPPYVNELRHCPQVVAELELPDGALPHHIDAAVNGPRTRGRRSTRPVRPAMRDRYRRMRAIKPRLGTIRESLESYRKDFASLQRVLEQSPLYYLGDIAERGRCP